MNNLVLRAKNWQVFLLTLVALLLMNLTITDYPLLSGVVGAVGYCLYFIWFAVMGNALAPLLPRDADYNLTWFLIDIALVTAVCASSVIIMDNRTYHAEGLEALPSFYLMFAMMHAPWFLAVSLVAVEKKRASEFGFYFGTLLLFLFWPLGLWFVQPRLNKVYEQRKRENQAMEG